jgi:hypothetical protein
VGKEGLTRIFTDDTDRNGQRQQQERNTGSFPFDYAQGQDDGIKSDGVKSDGVKSESLESGGVLGGGGFFEDLGYAVDYAVYVGGGGLPVADADAHGSAAAPGGAGEEGFAGGEDVGDDAVGEGVVVLVGGVFAGVEEADEALVDLWGPEDFGVGERADAGDDGVSVGAGSVDQVGDAGGA